METARAVLVALARRYAFGDLAALVDPRDAATRQLCAFGQRLLDLDAEDFGTEAVPADLRQRAIACRMPQASDERRRGALGTLRPAYALLLEVVGARWRRREMTAVVAGVHIMSEYAPLLAWEPVLGHAGDPVRLPAAVSGPDSFWGTDSAHCGHNRPDRAAARRASRVAAEGVTAWRSYLDRQHSNTAHALAVCAAVCRYRCSVVTRLSTEDQARVAHGAKLALALVDSPIVQLRHSAPVGHAFGVPSQREVVDAWQRSRHGIARLDRAVLADDGFPLPGLPSLLSTVAGAEIVPDSLVAETSEAVVASLGW